MSCSEEVFGWLDDVRVHQYLTSVQRFEKSTNQGADFKFDIDSIDTWFNLDCVPDLTCLVSSCVIWCLCLNTDDKCSWLQLTLLTMMHPIPTPYTNNMRRSSS